jgi:CRP-like cAMP-binding protein
MPRDTQKISALKTIPIFSDLSSKHLQKLAALTTKLSVAAGRTLAKQGDIGREAMIIKSGEASVISNGVEIADLGPGDFFGEMSLITDLPRNADVEAKTDMVVLVMSSSEFSSVLETEPMLATKILKTVVERLVANEGQEI